jgi:hypothetical protein
VRGRQLADGFATFLICLVLIAMSASPCQADVIHGCARKTNGQLRIVPEPGKCMKSEYPVTLSGMTQPNPVPRFEGMLCWLIASEPAIMRLDVAHLRDGHYVISGRIAVADTFYSAVHGSAILDGNNLYLTLVDSGKDGTAMWVGTTHAVLDRYSLNGTLEGIGHERRYADAFFEMSGIYVDADTRYGSGPFMTLTSCPRK